jgi:hypothetical protein
MTRELTDHIVNPVNDKLTVTAEDGPGAGGAHHFYLISGFDPRNNPSSKDLFFSAEVVRCFYPLFLFFQNGPINEAGINGITHESLIAILIDRLHCFQAGPYACEENACALIHLEAALESLHSRTRARMNCGVEGTSLKRATTNPHPIEPMSTTTRDPHFPPPVVVDWLLEQAWSERISSVEMSFPENMPFGISHSKMNGSHVAHTAIGRDETARLFMPDDALDVLREDHAIRQAALEEKRQACEADDLARKVLRQRERVCEAGS